LLSTASESQITAYIPFDKDQALLQIKKSNGRPDMKEGILFSLTLPPEQIADKVDINDALIMNMNLKENDSYDTGHFLGAWCLDRGRGDHRLTPTFITFIPSIACTPTVLVNMAYSTLGHCSWAEKVFFPEFATSKQNHASKSWFKSGPIDEEKKSNIPGMAISEPIIGQNSCNTEETIISHII
jgi:hypothetical protein